MTETTALGAAYLAGLAVGYWKSPASIASQWKVDRVFKPRMSKDQSQTLRARWTDALERAKGWEEPSPKRRLNNPKASRRARA